MELIDIIKSSILLFSILLLTLVFISFGLFKIRNQAKKKRLAVKKSAGENILPIRMKKTNKFEMVQLNLDSEEKLIETENTINNDKFIVINENINSAPASNFRMNYHPNVYKFYGSLDSKIMFKIKPYTRPKS